MRTDYVVGFAFDVDGAIALIRKERPQWQKNLWNGVGGHQEEGESGPDAMAREFKEETGMSTLPAQWRHAGQMYRKGVFRCVVYTATFSQLNVNTITDEMVRVFSYAEQQTILNSVAFPCIHNVPALLALVRMLPDTQSGDIPLFSLEY